MTGRKWYRVTVTLSAHSDFVLVGLHRSPGAAVDAVLESLPAGSVVISTTVAEDTAEG
jgi:hypothetical protein